MKLDKSLLNMSQVNPLKRAMTAKDSPGILRLIT